MFNIKVTIPGCPSGSVKDQGKYNSISKFLPNAGNIWKNCQFFINEEIEQPDYWVIIDNLNDKRESVNIDKNKIFFLSAEVPFVTSYFDDEIYLSQFYHIYSPHAIYHHDNHVSALPFLPFMIDAEYNKNVFCYNHNFNYDSLLVANKIKKSKLLSIIASNKGSNHHNMTEFHKIRYYFAQKLKEHFKDKIDLYGYG